MKINGRHAALVLSAVLAVGGLAGCRNAVSGASTAHSVPLPAPAASTAPAATTPGSPTGSATPAGPPKPTPTRPATPTPSTSSKRPHPATGHTGPQGSMRLTGSNAVALTFDDGPDPIYTPQILDLLAQQHVKATFCVIGSRARDYPALIRRIVAEGHTLCNHSWQHLLDLGKRPYSYELWDLRATNDAIHAAVPGAKIKYFRAPGGNFTPGLVNLSISLGMRPLYWDVDPRDWDTKDYGTGTPMVNHIVSTVEGTVRKGSIILSHDRGHPDTPVAYRILIPWLKQRYQLIALPTG